MSNTKGQMSGILLRKSDTKEESVLEAKGLFYGIGHSPNSQLLEGQVDLDSSGYILVEEGTAKTSVEGLFAAGDVQVNCGMGYYFSPTLFLYVLLLIVVLIYFWKFSMILVKCLDCYRSSSLMYNCHHLLECLRYHYS